MSKKYELISVELGALIILLVLTIRARVALVGLLILDITLIPLMFLRRKACCKDEDRGGVA